VPNTRNVDPAVVSARGRLANATRYWPDDDHTEIRRDLTEAKIAAYIQRELAQAPPLTPAQRDRLRVLLEPARVELSGRGGGLA
jgi:hypothetical protein